MRKQDGFSLLEYLLLLIAVGLIGFTGWYVYDSRVKTNKVYNESNLSSVKPPTKTATNGNDSSLPDKSVSATPTAAEKEAIQTVTANYLGRSDKNFTKPQESTLVSTDHKFALQYYCAPVQGDCSVAWLREVDGNWQVLGADIQLSEQDRLDLNQKYGWPLNFF